MDKAILACGTDEAAEIRTFGHTLSLWREEILNHHRTSASNGRLKVSNLSAKQVKRVGRGISNFSHYRLRGAPQRRWRQLAGDHQAVEDLTDSSALKPEEPLTSRPGAGRGHASIGQCLLPR